MQEGYKCKVGYNLHDIMLTLRNRKREEIPLKSCIRTRIKSPCLCFIFDARSRFNCKAIDTKGLREPFDKEMRPMNKGKARGEHGGMKQKPLRFR